jgi:hypothetical protein
MSGMIARRSDDAEPALWLGDPSVVDRGANVTLGTAAASCTPLRSIPFT